MDSRFQAREVVRDFISWLGYTNVPGGQDTRLTSDQGLGMGVWLWCGPSGAWCLTSF